jgi:hypothetical protein
LAERRQGYRFEPSTPDEELVELNGRVTEGVVSNLSEDGICIVVLADVEFGIDQQVTVDYRGHVAQAIVRNVTHDSMTVGYGLEWVDPLPVELLPKQLRIADTITIID